LDVLAINLSIMEIFHGEIFMEILGPRLGSNCRP
jgi:hypothetical protein